MKEETREMPKAELASTPANRPNLAEAIRRRIDPFGGVELTEFPREAVREPPACLLEKE